MRDIINYSSAGQGDVDDFHEFREKKFNFLYLCKKCARSFDAINAMEQCKYCSSPVTELAAKKRHPLLTASYYRYYCPKCERTFRSAVKHEECQVCGLRTISVYKWEDIPLLDKLMIRAFKVIKPRERGISTTQRIREIFGKTPTSF